MTARPHHPQLRQQAILDAVRRHATHHYTQGWDVVVESFTDAELLAEIGPEIVSQPECNMAVLDAIEKMAAYVALHADRRADIQGTADPKPPRSAECSPELGADGHWNDPDTVAERRQMGLEC